MSRRIAHLPLGAAAACAVLVMAGAGTAAGAESAPGAALAAEAISIDLGERLEEGAAAAILDIPTVDVAQEIGEVDSDGVTFEVTLPPGTYNDAAGVVRTYATRAAWKCTATADHPHYSAGAGGVIAKGRVGCTGSGGTLPVQVSMILGKNSSATTQGMSFVKTSTYTQNVVSNGVRQTWYVPKSGERGAAAGGYFRASIGAAAMPPVQATNIASHASGFVYIK
ncbi:hypothetical protein [Streptomyces sp.]|uniref:hypothetical protein n=1 Tax=Streptomyces sp. TaxID=1931 RepID=UPI002810C442|nr:hypothetical protein [Streptomyces sp.]